MLLVFGVCCCWSRKVLLICSIVVLPTEGATKQRLWNFCASLPEATWIM